MTFTEAATAELRDRVRSRLVEAEAAFRAARSGEVIADGVLRRLTEIRSGTLERDSTRLRRAVENIDDAPISTIHGFCQRVLHDHAFGTRVPFGAELVPDLGDLSDDVLYDFWQTRVAGASEGLARQAQALRVDVAALRRLSEEARRNPRVALVPPAGAPASPDQIAEALAEMKHRLAAFDGFGFVAEKALKTEFGGGPALAALLAGARAAIDQPDPANLHFPPDVERLFWSFVSAHLQKKFQGEADGHQAFFGAFERLVRLVWSGVLRLEHDLVREACQELFARKLRLGVLGFEDLLLCVADALARPGADELSAALRQRYKAVLIDEFQDTDPVQFEIFHGVFGDGTHPLFLIGDPKQAIYGFRGADVFAYLDAAAEARASTMNTSYRSDPGLLGAVNQLFRPAGSFLIEGIGYTDVGARPKAKDAFSAPHLPEKSATASLEILFLARTREDRPVNKPPARQAATRVVAADIAQLLNHDTTLARDSGTERVTAGDIAVLTRTNAQCFAMQEALRARGIHSVVITDSSVFESDEAADVEAVLAAVLDPASRFELRRAVATSLIGETGDDIAAKDADPLWWQEYAEKFRRWHDLWVERGFIQMFRALMDGTGAPKKLLARPGGERRLTNVLHLGELLHRATTELHLGPGALVAWLTDQHHGRAAAVERAEIRLESDDAAVKILTVHKAKGLEFPIVYCPFLWAGVGGGKSGGPCRFHDDDGRATIDIDVDAEARRGNVARARWESFAEEIRVAYVALTRAKHRSVVVWGGFNQMGASAAAYLLHPPDGLARFDVPAEGRLAKLTDDELRAPLDAYAARCNGRVAVRVVPWNSDARRDPESAASSVLLEARKIEQAVRSWQRTGSFTSLVKRELGSALDLDDGRDHDEEPVLVQGVDPEGAPAAERARITLDGFPRGRRTGDLIHDIFEELDFATVTDDGIAEIARSKLEGYGFTGGLDSAELDLRRDQLARALRETLETPLFVGGPRLADVSAREKFAELEFRMPVGEAGESLTRQRLARVFRDHPSTTPAGALSPGYAARVEQLGFGQLSGFLKGYVDLIFVHDGRWYVVDYKTNHLGDTREDYDDAAMAREMSHSHYFLQYHLYALALHRYLRMLQKGYDYEQHFGGVFYLFIKGMCPGASSNHGIFFEKPPLERLLALSDALAGSAAKSAELGAAP